VAENLPVDPGVPSDFSVPAMILPPGAQARVGAPVVASGNNAPRPMTLQNSSFTPYTPVEYQRQEAPPEMAPEMTQRQRLADFFFGLANSQSPSFFGAIGQAGQALSAGDRQRATAAREDRRAQAEENFRAAQIAVENAKLAQEREPTPANIARLATAQAQLTSAEASLINARRGPQAPQAQTTLVETSAGPAILNMQTNTLSPLPAGVITPQMQQRRDALIGRITNEAAVLGERAYESASRDITLSQAQRNEIRQTAVRQHMENNRALLERLGAPLPPAPAPGGGGNVRTFDPTGTRELNR
jgi:hypothetical protein